MHLFLGPATGKSYRKSDQVELLRLRGRSDDHIAWNRLDWDCVFAGEGGRGVKCELTCKGS